MSKLRRAPVLGALTLAMLVSATSPVKAVDNPDACRVLARALVAETTQSFANLTAPVLHALPDLVARTAFLNWSEAPARRDLPLQGDRIEVTTCWFVTPRGQTCMMGFAREAPRHRGRNPTLAMQALGSEPCADD